MYRWFFCVKPSPFQWRQVFTVLWQSNSCTFWVVARASLGSIQSPPTLPFFAQVWNSLIQVQLFACVSLERGWQLISCFSRCQSNLWRCFLRLIFVYIDYWRSELVAAPLFYDYWKLLLKRSFVCQQMNRPACLLIAEQTCQHFRPCVKMAFLLLGLCHDLLHPPRYRCYVSRV